MFDISAIDRKPATLVKRMKRRVFFGLGSNLGDRVETLRDAVASLPDVVRISSVYETEPVGGVEQDDFYNMVVESLTDIPARELLNIALSCEVAARRVRTVRDGPRTLDIDVLLIDHEFIDEPGLTVPHPRMYMRNFVIEPLREIAPEMIDESRVNGSGAVMRIGTLELL